ncbi:MAG: hypothetical protein ACOYNG_09270 [Terrimicrobiaceae bacterium]
MLAAEPTPTPIPIARAEPVPTPPDRQPPPLPLPGARSSAYQVAVLIPTASEAVDYLNKIAASDNALAENLSAARRAELCRRWLNDAKKPFEALAQNPATSTPAIEKLLTTARKQVSALHLLGDELKAQRISELESRQAARTALENSVNSRRALLATLAGTGA